MFDDLKDDKELNKIEDEYHQDPLNSEDEEEEEEIVYDDGAAFYLTQTLEKNENGLYTYRVYDYDDFCVCDWLSREDCFNMTERELQDSLCFGLFLREGDWAINHNYTNTKHLSKLPTNPSKPKVNSITKSNYFQKSIWDDDHDDSDDWYSNYKSYYSWKAPEKSKGFLDKLNKSNTLVIHCEDRSTDMLSQVYEGKGWDVLRDGNIDPEELHKLMESHDRIVCLGHGTPSGLINKQGGGYVVGESEVPYMKNKKLFVIWCYAATFGKKHGLHGFFTDNCPSEVWEVSAAGIHDKVYTSKYVLDNITYFCKLCGDVVEKALEGHIDEAIKYVREKYVEKFGHDGMTDFNCNTLQKL